ncbi:hypothetical protein ACIP98_37400 [Streptomyces sp. NPDC088354]|uniref:hypothetical protein n=1 Tax=Streptomyces sp. NPDC088354 TaxID=3365856 RepID=UPI0037FF0D13
MNRSPSPTTARPSRYSSACTVLAQGEGQPRDLIAFLNRDLLIAPWPVLRTLIDRPLRDALGERLPAAAHRQGRSCRVNLFALHRRLLGDVLDVEKP